MSLKKTHGGQLVLPKVLALGESHRLLDHRVSLVAVGEEEVGVCGGLKGVPFPSGQTIWPSPLVSSPSVDPPRDVPRQISRLKRSRDQPAVPPSHLVLESLVLLLEACEGANVLGGDAGRADGKLLVAPLAFLLKVLDQLEETEVVLFRLSREENWDSRSLSLLWITFTWSSFRSLFPKVLLPPFPLLRAPETTVSNPAKMRNKSAFQSYQIQIAHLALLQLELVEFLLDVEKVDSVVR